MRPGDEIDAMWVKICGNTNLEDAALAAELGADAVGFVFAPSNRQVTAEQVAAITPHLPDGVERVGVFYSRNAEEIAQIASDAGLTAVQLHGGLDEALLERLAERFAGGVRIIQTLHWTVGQQPTVAGESSAVQLAAEIKQVAAQGIADRVLIDSKVGTAGGGTGVAFDWVAARHLFIAAPSNVRLIVAGGLRPENVAHAISQLGPWGVDVSSGVEASPGRKDPAQIKRFIENARGAETP
jgi:phosphoribosylanthranilate isomerase